MFAAGTKISRRDGLKRSRDMPSSSFFLSLSFSLFLSSLPPSSPSFLLPLFHSFCIAFSGFFLLHPHLSEPSHLGKAIGVCFLSTLTSICSETLSFELNKDTNIKHTHTRSSWIGKYIRSSVLAQRWAERSFQIIITLISEQMAITKSSLPRLSASLQLIHLHAWAIHSN